MPISVKELMEKMEGMHLNYVCKMCAVFIFEAEREYEDCPKCGTALIKIDKKLEELTDEDLQKVVQETLR